MSTLIMVFGWLVFGLIAGTIARWIHPGRESMTTLGTMVLGVLGSLLGGGLGWLLGFGTSPYRPGGWILSILGAIILLALGVFTPGVRKT